MAAKRKSALLPCVIRRAENETRTRDPNLGKVVLYQLSYFRKEHFSKCGAKVRIFSYPPKFTEQKSC